MEESLSTTKSYPIMGFPLYWSRYWNCITECFCDFLISTCVVLVSVKSPDNSLKLTFKTKKQQIFFSVFFCITWLFFTVIRTFSITHTDHKCPKFPNQKFQTKSDPRIKYFIGSARPLIMIFIHDQC